MTIYVNRPGNKFVKAQDCGDEQSLSIYEDLAAQGYHFIYNGEINTYNSLHEFLKEQLNLYQKVQLCNLLAKSRKMCPINIKDDYEEYMSWHVGDKDYSYKDFFTELETGDETILDSCNDVFEEDLTYKDQCVVFNYLDSMMNPKHWHSWLIKGYSQGDDSWVWFYDESYEPDFNLKFTDDKQSSFYGNSIEEVLTEVLYGTYISLTPCDNTGNSSCIQESEQRIVAGFYIGEDDSLSNTSDEYLDKYMLKQYDMIPARANIIYRS